MKMATRPAEHEPEKPLGLVWVYCPSHPAPLALQPGGPLEAEAHVYRGRKPPEQGPLSVVVFCPSEEDEVASGMRNLRTLAPDAPILVFGPGDDPRFAWAALRAGARGFVHDGMRPAQIVREVLRVSKGEIAFPARGVLF